MGAMKGFDATGLARADSNGRVTSLTNTPESDSNMPRCFSSALDGEAAPDESQGMSPKGLRKGESSPGMFGDWDPFKATKDKLTKMIKKCDLDRATEIGICDDRWQDSAC